MGYTHFDGLSVINKDATMASGLATGAKDAEVPIVFNTATSSEVVAAGTLAIPITKRLVTKSTGGAEALTLANGTAGQKLTIYITAGVGTGSLTPATSLNFGTVLFIAAWDTGDFEYVDDTVGWIITGAAGVLAPPVISAA